MDSKYGKWFSDSLAYSNSKLIKISELDKLPTHRLLAYFKKYRTLRYSGICPCCNVRYADSREEERYYEDCELYINQIKKLLNKREHVRKR